MNFKSLILISLISFLVFSCSGISKSNLIGKWQAVEMYENDELVEVDLSSVFLNFDKLDNYEYSGTLKYMEKGQYELKKSILFTTDQLNPESQKKAVEIIHLDADSLNIKMLDNGKIRLLKMVREK